MFDGIGTTRDPEAAQRSALATLIASLIVGGGVAFTLGVGAWTAREMLVKPAVDDTPITMVELDEPDVAVAPPPVEAPRLGGGQQAQQGEPDAAPAPDEPVEPTELDDAPSTEMADSETRGERDGTGDAETTIDAPVGQGRPDGNPGGTGNGPPIEVVHRSEVTLRRMIEPEFPNDAEASQACRVSVDIGEGGRAAAIRITDCDAPYAREARRAIEKWRWYGRDAGKRTTYRVVFEGR
ncbi:MAG: hypothetical protein H6737_16815 [Alphaproteobacteria bacterium]|nr:hypothetical protein [Alphaproteobacteria bacterium]